MSTEARRTATVERPRPGTPPTPTVPRPERFRLPNGLRVVAVRRAEFPQVAARLIVPAGAASDRPGAHGIASLVGALLTEGTQDRSALELNERIDSLGASLGARVGHDIAEVDLTLLAETLDEGLQLLAEVVSTAAFPAKEVERIRAETLDALEARLDEPANVADDRVAEAIFGQRHPYGRLPIGTREGVRTIRRAQLVDFHRARYRPEGSVLVIVGDFDIGELRRLLETTFAGWAGKVGATRYPEPPTVAVEAGTRSVITWPDAAQGEIRVAGVGMPRRSPDWIPAAVANFILGGSTITGRLGANLREDKGWTYGVRCAFGAGMQPAGWVIETAVDAAATDAALDEIGRELSRIVAEPVDPEELVRAREALILSLPRAFETPAQIVARLATIEVFALDPDYWQRFPERVEQVTEGDVSRIATGFFDPERLVRVTVGPPAGG
jgi:zinc protease